MNNFWESLQVGKVYCFDMEYVHTGSRHTKLIEGTIKQKLTDSNGKNSILLENNTMLSLDNITRYIGPF
jgi:hypothetical protein